jgi:hypothetical protein
VNTPLKANKSLPTFPLLRLSHNAPLLLSTINSAAVAYRASSGLSNTPYQRIVYTNILSHLDRRIILQMAHHNGHIRGVESMNKSNGNKHNDESDTSSPEDSGIMSSPSVTESGPNSVSNSYIAPLHETNGNISSAHAIEQAFRKLSIPPNQPYIRGAFRNSSMWMSDEQKQYQNFIVIRNAMKRLFKNSEVAKWKIHDYISHREAMVASEKARLAQCLKIMEEDMAQTAKRTPQEEEYTKALAYCTMATLNLNGNRSLVLGEKTIWCVDWQNGKEEVSPWPSFAEMKWEGDDRAKTGVGRFLPLPRENGAPGLIWSQLQVIEQYRLDQVQLIPTMEDVYAPIDEIDDNVKYNLITKDLEDAMDAQLRT